MRFQQIPQRSRESGPEDSAANCPLKGAASDTGHKVMEDQLSWVLLVLLTSFVSVAPLDQFSTN